MRTAIVIPNLISALRLGLAAWFPFAPEAARAWLLIAAGVSDLADGYIARRYHLSSWVGGLLDATADKFFAFMALMTFTVGPELAWWHPIPLLLRDITVALIACYAVVRRKWYAFRHMPARALGKCTTAAMFVLFLLLAAGTVPVWITDCVIWLVALLSGSAGVDYFLVFLHAKRADRARGM